MWVLNEQQSFWGFICCSIGPFRGVLASSWIPPQDAVLVWGFLAPALVAYKLQSSWQCPSSAMEYLLPGGHLQLHLLQCPLPHLSSIPPPCSPNTLLPLYPHVPPPVSPTPNNYGFFLNISRGIICSPGWLKFWHTMRCYRAGLRGLCLAQDSSQHPPTRGTPESTLLLKSCRSLTPHTPEFQCVCGEITFSLQ